MIQYPYELLRVLLNVFQSQQFTNGTTLSWTSWAEACRRPSDLIQVVGEYMQCCTLRAFVLCVLWNAPKQIPAWTCECFGLECGEGMPEVITEAPKEIRNNLERYSSSQSVVSRMTSFSHMSAKLLIAVPPRVQADSIDLLRSIPEDRMAPRVGAPPAFKLEGGISPQIKREAEIGLLNSISNMEAGERHPKLVDLGSLVAPSVSKHPWARRPLKEVDPETL